MASLLACMFAGVIVTLHPDGLIVQRPKIVLDWWEDEVVLRIPSHEYGWIHQPLDLAPHEAKARVERAIRASRPDWTIGLEV